MKENDKIIGKVTLELKALSEDPRNVKDYSKFHKDGESHIGIVSALVKKVSAENYREIKSLGRERIFSLCDRLLENKGSGYKEIAFNWAFRTGKYFREDDIDIFERWIGEYVSDWASCDDLCTHSLGELVWQFPGALPRFRDWAGSKNKWFRRASVVSLIYPLRRGRYFKEAFELATILLEDNEDMVQKGYGWMLKEASKLRQKEVFDFVVKNKKLMPRTALRYAVEKMPEKMRKEAMK